ncbi:MAG: zeta toxin family protein [Bacteroidales bacterium]|nr:zeta toxin family protein [Bacteroidales bacterium]
MQTNEVLGIFEEKKEEYFREIYPDSHPCGILLGGQGAVGKGQLNLWAERLYPDRQFFAINGDNYRNWHPQFGILCKDLWNYSKETQIFSNVFTEGLIDESVRHRYSFVVEGTMRSASVPLQTAAKLRFNGYETAAFAIAACKEFSLLNAFVRYFKEMQSKGFGRMIEIDSHNAAVEGLPTSLDKLYAEKSVDRICLFDCFARNMIADYRLSDGEWSCATLPSFVIMEAREQQKKDKEAVESLLEVSENIFNQLDNERVKALMKMAYDDLVNRAAF